MEFNSVDNLVRYINGSMNQYDTTQYDTTQYDTTKYDTTKYDANQYDTIQCDMSQSDTTQCDNTICDNSIITPSNTSIVTKLPDIFKISANVKVSDIINLEFNTRIPNKKIKFTIDSYLEILIVTIIVIIFIIGCYIIFKKKNM